MVPCPALTEPCVPQSGDYPQAASLGLECVGCQLLSSFKIVPPLNVLLHKDALGHPCLTVLLDVHYAAPQLLAAWNALDADRRRQCTLPGSSQQLGGGL